MIQVEAAQGTTSQVEYFKEQGDRAIVENAARRCIARIFQRNSPEGRNQRPLLTYDTYGEVLINPSEGEYRPNFEQRVIDLFQKETLRLSSKEKQYMGMVVPELVGALLLDEDLVGKVYEPDLINLVGIALDWFKHPEDIDQTHFRIGFGGEAGVNSRAPAYIVPAINTLQRIQKVFAVHTNYGLQHELHERRGGNFSTETNGYLEDRIKQEIGERDGNFDYLAEIQNPTNLAPEQAQQIIKEAWVNFLGYEPDLKEMQQKYHSTYKLPKIIVFNAAHAAIEIDKMDPILVLTARDKTQQLLKSFVEEFHPNIAESLLFQNDTPWEEHNDYTQMMILYVRDIIDHQDGQMAAIDKTLTQFGQHHQRDESNQIKGMPAPKAYAVLHPFFFEDPQTITEWRQRLPKTNIMEPLVTPRHVIFHQGEPEIKFGAYRKIASQNMEASDFVKWVERRRILTGMNHDQIAQAISAKAEKLLVESNGRRDYRSCLGQAINTTCKDTPTVKAFFISWLGSPTFTEAADKRAAWLDYTDRLVSEKPNEDPEVLKALVKQIESGQDTIDHFKDTVDHAKTNAPELLVDLAQDPLARFVSYPRSRSEIVVGVGKIPVYYPLIGTDAVIWPNDQTPSLNQYNSQFDRTVGRRRRLQGTAGFTNTKVVPEAVRNGHDESFVFAEPIRRYIDDAVGDATLVLWQNEDRSGFIKIYEEVDQYEQGGTAIKEDVEIMLRRGVRALVERRVEAIVQATGLSYDEAKMYIERYYPVKSIINTANQELGQDAEVDIIKHEGVRSDYLILLSSIDSDPIRAEEKYKQLIASI